MKSTGEIEIPTLEGPRLRLEPLSHLHTVGMFELWREPLVCEHSGPAEDSNGDPIELPAPSRSQSDRLLQYWLDRQAAGSGFRWAALLAGRQVGALGFNRLGEHPEYAFHFLPRDWGVGLASEGSKLALSWAFARGAVDVEAYIESANERSIRLVQRLGFRCLDDPPEAPARWVLSGPYPFGGLAR